MAEVNHSSSALDKLRWLQEHAHSVHIDVNDHRSYYQTVAQMIDDDERYRNLDANIKAECIRRDQLVIVQCYPNTPVGFFSVAHYDVASAIELAFDLALETLG